MPVKITNIQFRNELRTEAVNWLLANVGDKIQIEIDFTVETSAVSNLQNKFTFNSTNGYIGTGWQTNPKPIFKDFKVGDTVILYNYITNVQYGAGSYTIIDKPNNFAIRLNADVSGVGQNGLYGEAVISVTTPISAIKYKWNFVENDEQPNFFSKVDGTEHLLIHKNKLSSDLTTSAMEFIGKKDYQIGNATVEGEGITSSPVYKSNYKIIHNTFITPFILESQLTNLASVINPDYFFNHKCLTAIFDIEAAYNYTDPNYLQTVQLTTVDGNTGWFNENFNTSITNYYIDSVVFKRPDTTVIPAIELTTGETSVEIVVKNTIDSPFVNSNTKYVLNICKVPVDADEYTGNTKTQDQNFLFDRKLCTLGAASVNGDNYGTGYQILKDITSTFIISNEMKISFKVAMGSDVLANLNNSEEARYMLWVTIQDHTLSTENADKVSLLVDDQEFFIDNSDPGMIVTSNKFLRHPGNDPVVDGLTSLTVFPEDEIVAYSQFYIDRNGRASDVIDFSRIKLKVKAKNSITLDEFILDSYEADLSSANKINTNPYFDISVNRLFHIPNTEIRKPVKLKRRNDLDAGGLVYYETWFPFLFRWEEWVKIVAANDDFFDTGEPNNGFNQNWYRYSQGTNWGIYYEIEINVKKNGITQIYNTETEILTTNYDTNADWETESIKAYDLNNNLLYDGVNLKSYLLGYDKTKIVVEMTKIPGPPNPLKVGMVLGIETFEQGGIEGRRRISSYYEHDADTWWESIDGSKKIKLTITGNTLKGEAILDNTKLPAVDKFKITARVYDLEEIQGKLFQDNQQFLFQDGENYLFQDQ